MIVFLGTLYTYEDEKRLLETSKGVLQGAANNYQWGLLQGLAHVCGQPILTINSIPMGAYPRHSRILFERASVEKTPEAEIRSHGYINLPIIKQLQRECYAYRSLKKLICSSTEPVTVIVYSLYNPYLRALSRLKKEGLDFRYILVVTDLPGEYGVESGDTMIRALQRRIGQQDLALSQAADGYVLLTEQMTVPLSVGDKPYVVVEGIYNCQEQDPQPVEKQSPRVILYTGALDTALGLDTLIEAFRMLPAENVQLHIAGGGPYVGELKRICAETPNIHYLGYLSKHEVVARQRSATILVNPRSGNMEYTKYSFPSKTIEYLATGTPVVMNRLPGVPAEYENYVFFTERDDASGLAQTLEKVLAMDEAALAAHGDLSADFIRRKKSGAAQAQKLLTLLEA